MTCIVSLLVGCLLLSQVNCQRRNAWRSVSNNVNLNSWNSGNSGSSGNSGGGPVSFYLYTPESPREYRLIPDDLNNLRSSTFNPNRPTKILIHGYTNNYQSESMVTVRDAYLRARDVNVIVVDWRTLAAGNYGTAVNNARQVGQEVARMVDFLVSSGQSLDDIHIIGHSLGAHVAGFAGKSVSSGTVHRITGLDPAGPMFNARAADSRLDAGDAEVVDVIHTAGGTLGILQPIGTHDFYPNGGRPPQPGCGSNDMLGSCSHSRAYQYFASSITNDFPATSCSSMTEAMTGNCFGDNTAYMGDPAENGPEGVYYLETSSTYPYT